MMTLKPFGFFTWDSSLVGPDMSVVLNFKLFGERGQIYINGMEHEVVKENLFSGNWSLSKGGEIIAEAEKTSIFSRAINIYATSGSYSLMPDSMFGHAMTLRGPGVQLTFKSDHMFTRKSSVTGEFPVIEITSFAAWLTLLTWRRTANHSAN